MQRAVVTSKADKADKADVLPDRQTKTNSDLRVSPPHWNSVVHLMQIHRNSKPEPNPTSDLTSNMQQVCGA